MRFFRQLGFIPILIIFLTTPVFAQLDVDLDNNDALDVGFGGTNATTEEDARTNLNLEIGVDVLSPTGDGSGLLNVQGASDYLDDIADLTPVANNLLGWNAGATDVENKSSINIQFVSDIEFEGATADDYEVTFSVDDPGKDISWNLPFSNPVKTATKTSAYTIGTDSSAESYGGVIYVTSAAVITAPAVVAGMNFTVITIGAIAVSLDVNASDKMYLDGTLLDDGDKATNTSTTGDIIHCSYYSADGWYCASGSPDGDHWTDGGA